ncbi:HpcH/HpaI aldolase/citrate lyase family protein [Virgibacillus byunsanensis]|uniref:HpcH/HpaI aldolase/citrate lyase family protein n=1 Tax=Virgibacillus byunsanensis TaxID=570945 RepID=A0ABW3LIX8_9BACI
MDKSYLFVPGNQFERIGKAIRSEADAVIIDLEDSIAIKEKNNARSCAERALDHYEIDDKQVYIRINDLKSDFWTKDAELLVKYPFVSVMLPKTESAEDIYSLNSNLSFGQKIIPLIETAKGIASSTEIATSAQNIVRLAFGAVDYCLDLGISITQNEHELIYPRSSLVVASRAADIQSPIDTVYVNIEDDSGFLEETKLAIQLGLFAKLCIHPKQVKLVNQLFVPSKTDVQWAKEVITTFEEAESQGLASIKLNGGMIDYPVYKQALSIVERIK